MIELTLTQYLEKLKVEKAVAFPTEHVFEADNYFLLFFKSREKWDYATIILKSDILGFSSIEDFKINYCSNHLPVAESPIWLPFIDSDDKELESIPVAIGKKIDFDDIVEKSENYADFLIKMFDTFEKEVLKSVNKIDKSHKLNKNFGEFLSDLFNTVNSAHFAKVIKKFLKTDVEFGRLEAEKELKTNIPFNRAFEQKLAVLYSEQLNGYTINGKKWFGIKGVTKEIQQKVIETVQSGINENKSNADISKDVKATFSNFTDWRSNMIARTETSRIIASSRHLGYKESGLEGVKVWSTAPYESGRSSDICQRLSGQAVGLHEDFIDPGTMKAYQHEPAHPNCRSRTFFRPN